MRNYLILRCTPLGQYNETTRYQWKSTTKFNNSVLFDLPISLVIAKWSGKAATKFNPFISTYSLEYNRRNLVSNRSLFSLNRLHRRWLINFSASSSYIVQARRHSWTFDALKLKLYSIVFNDWSRSGDMHSSSPLLPWFTSLSSFA